MTLQSIIDRMITDVAAVTGIKGASNYLPEALPSSYPWVIGYAGQSTFEVYAGEMKGLYSVVLEIHVPRQNLPSAIATVMPYYEAIPKKLIQDLLLTHLNNTCDTFGNIEASGLISFSYAGLDTIGMRYTIKDVKLFTTL